MTHRSGKGFGQDRSTSYFGAPACACDEGGQARPAAIAKTTHAPTLTRTLVFLFIFGVLLGCVTNAGPFDLDMDQADRLGSLKNVPRQKLTAASCAGV